jgi:hypothetical protein
MPLSQKQRERKRQVLSELDAIMRRAMVLYMGYKTTTEEYKAIAAKLNLDIFGLNVRCNEIYGCRIILGK